MVKMKLGPIPHHEQQERVAEAHAQQEKRRVDAIVEPPPPPPTEKDGSSSLKFINENPTVRVLYCEDLVSGVWPAHTNELCRWCLQPFSGTPVGIPRAYDSRELKFKLDGYFCSFNCAVALAATQPDSYQTIRNIRHLARDFYGAHFQSHLIQAAPPREKLSWLHAKYATDHTRNDAMRSAMSDAIRDFRGDSAHTIVHPQPAPPFYRVTQAVDEQEKAQQKDQKHQDRLELMVQEPRPILHTDRGAKQQRKYVLDRHRKDRNKAPSAIGDLLNINYAAARDDDD